MQLKSSEDNIQEMSVSFGGDKFTRTEDKTYGNLLSEIDNKKKRIDYNRNLFSAELSAIPKKRKYILSGIIVNICIMIVVAAICFFISTHSSFGLFLHVATYIFIIYMLVRIIRYIRIYLINIDCGFSKKYRVKHGVNTLVNEEEYCTSILSSLPIYLDKLSDMELHITQGDDIDTDAFTKALDNIPDEFEEFKYNAGKIQF